jgi:hypothetical protein
MKRVFIINGEPHWVPSFLTETPQKGSFVAYKGTLYKVADIMYGSESQEVGIVLNKEKR